MDDFGIEKDVIRGARKKIKDMQQDVVREIPALMALHNKDWHHVARAMDAAEEQISECGHVPGSLKEISKTPLYLLHPILLGTISGKIRGCEHVGKDLREQVCEHILKFVRHNTETGVKRRRRDIILSAVADVGARPVGCYADDPKKERVMHEKIEEHLGKRSSNAPIMAIIWKNYADNIGKKLEESGIKHRVIKLPPVSNDSARILHRK